MHWWMIGKSGNIHHFRRVLYPYNTFYIQMHQTIFDFYHMHIIGVVRVQHPTFIPIL